MTMTMSGSLFEDDPFKVSQALDAPATTKIRKKSSGSSSHERPKSSRGHGHSKGSSSRDKGHSGRDKPRRQTGGSQSLDTFGFDDNAFSDDAFGSAFSDPSFDAPAPAPAAPAPPAGRQRRARRSSTAASSGPPASHSKEHEPAAADYGYENHAPAPATPDPAAAAAPRRRGRRSSMYGDGGPASRHVSGVRSCEGLEDMASKRTQAAASGDSGDQARRQRRGGRRAAPVSYSGNAAPDYGDGHAGEQVDYGCGDSVDSADNASGEDEAKKDRPRMRRQCSVSANLILDDLKSVDISSSANANRQTSTRQIGANSAAANMVAPMVLPMAEEKVPPRRQRRASLIGAVGLGGPKKTKEVEKAPQYDPSQDRERRNAGGLLQRVNAGTTESGSSGQSGGRSSYSDRIMQGR